MAAGNELIDVDTLFSLLGDDDTRIIDCRFDLNDKQRGERQFLEAHLPGAVFADLEMHLSAEPSPLSGRHPLPKVKALDAFFSHCGIDKDVDVVVYDAGNGAMAARCWWLLKWLGHSKVRLLDGGMDAWTIAEHPVESGAQVTERRQFRGTAAASAVLKTEEIQSSYPNISALRLFDARDHARFTGDHEPIDAVAGHIPGAVSFPLHRSLDDSGRWRNVQALKALWSEALDGAVDQPWAVMCGSGITACHLALSAAQAGVRAPRLYAGSWSEWIRDADRPKATGSR